MMQVIDAVWVSCLVNTAVAANAIAHSAAGMMPGARPRHPRASDNQNADEASDDRNDTQRTQSFTQQKWRGQHDPDRHGKFKCEELGERDQRDRVETTGFGL